MPSKENKKAPSNQQVGRVGEELACEYLMSCGYTICARNYHCPYGEIDIIASKAGATYFVEVKTRRSLRYGHPFESILPSKIVKMKKSIHCYRDSKVVQNPQILFISVLLNNQVAPCIEVIPFEG